MPAAIVLAPESAADQATVDTVAAVSPAVEEVTVVCDPARQTDLDAAVDAQVIAPRVPNGGPVAAMRAGFRSTSALAAVVTTPELPTLVPSAVAPLEPTDGADAVLARVDGERHPPLGGYAVTPAVRACDQTLATGSRRLPDVFSRLSVTATTIPTPPTEPNARAKHET